MRTAVFTPLPAKVPNAAGIFKLSRLSEPLETCTNDQLLFEHDAA